MVCSNRTGNCTGRYATVHAHSVPCRVPRLTQNSLQFPVLLVWEVNPLRYPTCMTITGPGCRRHGRNRYSFQSPCMLVVGGPFHPSSSGRLRPRFLGYAPGLLFFTVSAMRSPTRLTTCAQAQAGRAVFQSPVLLAVGRVTTRPWGHTQLLRLTVALSTE
jgi:hypothetical protein